MEYITQDMIENYTVKGVKYWEHRSLSADAEGKANGESIQLRPTMSVDNVTVGDLIRSAFNPKWINKQTSLRKVFAGLKPNQVVEFTFVAPAKQVIDGMTAVRNETATMTRDEKLAYLKKLENELVGN